MGDQLVCEWPPGRGWPTRGVRVVVDEDGGTVTFERCHTLRRFWAIRPEPSYTCRLDEVWAVYLSWADGDRFITLSTATGKVEGINSGMDGFNEVVTVLRRHVGPNHGRLLDNPHVWHVGGVVFCIVFVAIGTIWALR
jgi:hypothetical protein